MSEHPQRRDDLVIDAAADGYLVRVPSTEAVTWLNRTGYMVLQLCTGENATDFIAKALSHAFDLAWSPVQAVRETVAELVAAGLVAPGAGTKTETRKLEIVVWAPGLAVAPEVVTGILNLRSDAENSGVPAAMVLERDRSLRSARNRAANRVTRDASVSHLLYVDATPQAIGAIRDVGLSRLLAADHEVIGVPVQWPVPAWDRALDAASKLPGLSSYELECYAHGYDTSFAHMPEAQAVDGFLEARHCASSAMIVRRSALERIAGSGVATRNRGAVTQGAVFTNPGWGFFDSGLSGDGIDIDEDLAFCERVRASGGAVMVDVTGAFGTCVRVGMRLQAAQA